MKNIITADRTKWVFTDSDGVESQFNKRDKSYWVIWSPGNGEPKVSHEFCQDARDEAKRLADLNPGKIFIVLKADSEFCANGKSATYMV